MFTDFSFVNISGQDPLLLGGGILLFVWTILWKALGLWHAARNKDPRWFVAIFLLNSLGILELIYLFGVRKMTREQLFSRE